MNGSSFNDTEGIPTDRVTSQNRLPECYPHYGEPPKGGEEYLFKS